MLCRTYTCSVYGTKLHRTRIIVTTSHPRSAHTRTHRHLYNFFPRGVCKLSFNYYRVDRTVAGRAVNVAAAVDVVVIAAAVAAVAVASANAPVCVSASRDLHARNFILLHCKRDAKT